MFDPITGHLFGLASSNQLFEFDPTTRELISVTELDELIRYPSPVPHGRRPQGMVFSADGSKLYITATNSGDGPGTGKLVVLNRTVVPEPSTMALASSLALAVAAMQRRRVRSLR